MVLMGMVRIMCLLGGGEDRVVMLVVRIGW